MGTAKIRLIYLGRDDSKLQRIPPGREETIDTAAGPWKVGQELLPIRRGVYCWRKEMGGGDGIFMTFTVGLERPPLVELED